jgi:hypothetical protein
MLYIICQCCFQLKCELEAITEGAGSITCMIFLRMIFISFSVYYRKKCQSLCTMVRHFLSQNKIIYHWRFNCCNTKCRNMFITNDVDEMILDYKQKKLLLPCKNFLTCSIQLRSLMYLLYHNISTNNVMVRWV